MENGLKDLLDICTLNKMRDNIEGKQTIPDEVEKESTLAAIDRKAKEIINRGNLEIKINPKQIADQKKRQEKNRALLIDDLK